MRVYTKNDWEKDGTFKAHTGQEISAEVLAEMRTAADITLINGVTGLAEYLGTCVNNSENKAFMQECAHTVIVGVNDKRYYYIGCFINNGRTMEFTTWREYCERRTK